MITSRTQIPGSQLTRALGAASLAAAIVNVTIGGSIFAIPGSLYATLGPAAPLAFLLGALLFTPIVLCFAAAGSRVTATGGPYRYVDDAFGRFPAFLLGAVFWISNVAGSAGMAAILAAQLGAAFPVFAAPLPRAAMLLVVYAALAALNATGVRVGARAILLLAAMKAVPLALLAVVAAPQVVPAHLRVAAWPSLHALASSLVIVVFAYSGIETALAPSGELRDPARTVPRAALAGVGIVIALYVALQIVAQGVLGPALAGHGAPLAALADRILPGGGRILLPVAVVSLVGVIQGDLLGSSRLLYALADDGFLPRPLAAVSPASRVPLAAIVAHAACACALAVAGTFEELALISGGAFCLVYLGCCAAAWRLQRAGGSGTGGGGAGGRDPRGAFRLRGGGLVPLLGITALLGVLATLEGPEWRAIGGALALLALLYALRRWTERG